MGSSVSKLGAEEEAKLARRCAARRTALAGCRAANPDAPAACERLEAALVMCFAAGERRRPAGGGGAWREGEGLGTAAGRRDAETATTEQRTVAAHPSTPPPPPPPPRSPSSPQRCRPARRRPRSTSAASRRSSTPAATRASRTAGRSSTRSRPASSATASSPSPPRPAAPARRHAPRLLLPPLLSALRDAPPAAPQAPGPAPACPPPLRVSPPRHCDHPQKASLHLCRGSPAARAATGAPSVEDRGNGVGARAVRRDAGTSVIAGGQRGGGRASAGSSARAERAPAGEGAGRCCGGGRRMGDGIHEGGEASRAGLRAASPAAGGKARAAAAAGQARPRRLALREEG
jgi:hypothetical protein